MAKRKANPKLLGEIGRIDVDRGNCLVVTIDRYRGVLKVGCRICFLGENGSLHPTRAGFKLPPEFLPKLRRQLKRAARHLDGQS